MSGDLLILKSTLNRAFRTSMEVGVKVWVENTIDGTLRHVASAYLTFVAVDPQGRRCGSHHWNPKRTEDKRRYQEAGRRREKREAEARAQHPQTRPRRFSRRLLRCRLWSPCTPCHPVTGNLIMAHTQTPARAAPRFPESNPSSPSARAKAESARPPSPSTSPSRSPSSAIASASSTPTSTAPTSRS